MTEDYFEDPKSDQQFLRIPKSTRIVILTILVGLAIPLIILTGVFVRKLVMINQTEYIIQALHLALESYKSDHMNYPDDVTEGKFRNEYYRDLSENWKIQDGKNYDSWDNPINVEKVNPGTDTEKIKIWSNGPNGKNENGGGDDIKNWP